MSHKLLIQKSMHSNHSIITIWSSNNINSKPFLCCLFYLRHASCIQFFHFETLVLNEWKGNSLEFSPMQTFNNLQSFEFSPELSQLVSFLIAKNVCMVNYMNFHCLMSWMWRTQHNSTIISIILCLHSIQSNYYSDKD